MNYRKSYQLFLLALLLVACGPALPTATPLPPTSTPAVPTPSSEPGQPDEQPVTAIPLSGPASAATAEFSGLAWYGDHLVLLPQYPGRFSGGEDGALLVLKREVIEAYLGGASTTPLVPEEVPFSASGLAATVDGFEGYEAIAFDGDRAYLTIEASTGGTMHSYLVAGRVTPGPGEVRVDPANGAQVNPDPVAQRFDLSPAPAGAVPFPQIEYRITDATALDDAGRFWAINYFFPGEVELEPQVDPLAARYGQGASHAIYPHVERLVLLAYDGSAIRLVDQPPLQLTLPSDEARNWEGIVRFDSRGFLLVTDKFPETILAFVPSP
jgi:hypothetical protein